MAEYMVLVYEEVEAVEQAERERVTPVLVELHAGFREAGAEDGRREGLPL